MKSGNILDQANKLIFVKDYENGDKLIQQVLQSPEFRDQYLVHLRRIELAEKLGKLDELQETYRSFLKSNPDTILYRVLSIWVEQFKNPGDSSRIVEQLQELLKQYGPHPATFYGIAMCMEVLENWDRALFNYEQCINLDPQWYPGYFGLSQIHYHKNDEEKGDYYFHLYEESAPYNVYGNFETHRKLANEFLESEQFSYARTAIITLSEWWIENKGSCPPEIQVYEYLMLSKISDAQGSLDEAMHFRNQAMVIANRVLSEVHVMEGVLYFIAKAFEEFSEFKQAFLFYKKILSQEIQSPDMVQKIGGQFLSLGEYKLAQDLFLEAYKHHPDNAEIRFCLLVANLKHAGVHVEEYLIGKERMKQLVESPGDKVEMLSLLHSLLAKYKDDPDVHFQMGEIYLNLGNVERASRHFRRMYELDQLSRISALKYASFEMQYGDANHAMNILGHLSKNQFLTRNELTEINWLKSTFYFRTRDFEKAYLHLEKVKAFEPWNVSYLIHEILVLTGMHLKDDVLSSEDSVMKKLARNDEENLDWQEFDHRTSQIEALHFYELVYAREKLHFLYGVGQEVRLEKLVSVASQYNPSRGTHDFLRLLNTNFDSPRIYWALGMLFKETWQLETACMWFEQILLFPGSERSDLGKAYLEIADCFAWRNLQLPKALEYVKLAMELGERGDGRVLTIMAHVLLKMGQVRQAQVYLEDNKLKADPEATYLAGLVQYRNGAHQKANQLWKPLLTHRSESLRFHHIKQEILKYYFEKSPYQGAN